MAKPNGTRHASVGDLTEAQMSWVRVQAGLLQPGTRNVSVRVAGKVVEALMDMAAGLSGAELEKL